jgi:hypothetical protein
MGRDEPREGFAWQYVGREEGMLRPLGLLAQLGTSRKLNLL